MVKMNEKEMLDYIKQFNGKSYGSKKEIMPCVQKLERLITKFGYKYHHAFMGICYYRKETEKKYVYNEIQMGWAEDKVYTGKSRGQKHHISGFKGVVKLTKYEEDINPRTGEPWKIGDVKYHESGCYSTILTKRGWWSGD